MQKLKENHNLRNRPGGFRITDRAVSYCSFQPGARILDLGCGAGDTVNYLTQQYGFEAYGLDKEPGCIQGARIIKASAEEIPCPDTSIDGVIIECSLSLMDDRQKVLKECFRILKPDGKLMISDVYSLNEPVQLSGCLGLVDSMENIISVIQKNGFRIDHSDDFTDDLNSLWGQLIMDRGIGYFYNNLGVEPEAFKKIKCGYYLIVASKTDVLP